MRCGCHILGWAVSIEPSSLRRLLAAIARCFDGDFKDGFRAVFRRVPLMLLLRRWIADAIHNLFADLFYTIPWWIKAYILGYELMSKSHGDDDDDPSGYAGWAIKP